MHSDQQRIETATSKAQSMLKPGSMEATATIKDGIKGKKRGPQKKSAREEEGIGGNIGE